jgi:hypothetical protein
MEHDNEFVCLEKNAEIILFHVTHAGFDELHEGLGGFGRRANRALYKK